ncbi:hypothetical protein, partial [Bosea sp. (in: a-proteobacteria)]|uniref:hypothetical protein n=1 Tax=Bosea sp. (in: a-proteobacteria) TaxID=1871050 RepID=UPI0025C67C08
MGPQTDERDPDPKAASRAGPSRIAGRALLQERQTRSTAYADTTKLLIDAASVIEWFLGAQMDQAAMAAWHERVVTVLRLAADAADRADRRRGPVINKLKTLYRKYVEAEYGYDGSPEGRRKIDRLASLISGEVHRFAVVQNRSLPCQQPHDLNGIVRFMEPLNATIIAFFGGIDPASFAPVLSETMSRGLAPILTMSIAMGRLQREGVSLLNPFLANAIIATIDEIGLNSPAFCGRPRFRFSAAFRTRRVTASRFGRACASNCRTSR